NRRAPAPMDRPLRRPRHRLGDGGTPGDGDALSRDPGPGQVLAFMDDFRVLAMMYAALVVLVLLMRRVRTTPAQAPSRPSNPPQSPPPSKRTELPRASVAE